MTMYARVVNTLVVEVADQAAYNTFNPTVQAMFIVCPDNVEPFWTYTPPSTWTPPA